MTISCDAIKIAMRQNKEGYVISFSIPPQEMHSDLADALIPSYWRLTLTPMDEQGNFETPAASMPARGAAKEEVDAAPRPQSNRLARQAAICCRDPVFQKYLQEINSLKFMPDSIWCAEYVRAYCMVTTRKNIIVGSPAGAAWEKLYSKFTVWKLVPA